MSTHSTSALTQALQTRLWLRPVAYSFIAILAVAICVLLDEIEISARWTQKLKHSDILLSTLTASMLGVVTFAVTSMVGAFSSVGRNATPRAFSLIVEDDTSKTALSSFVAAFVFALVGRLALEQLNLSDLGLVAFFVASLLVTFWVLIVLLRWIDAIANLGRMDNILGRLEQTTCIALSRRANAPHLGTHVQPFPHTRVVSATSTGYVSDIDLAALQRVAADNHLAVTLLISHGDFIGTGDPLFGITKNTAELQGPLEKCVTISRQRNFADDPRFGLIALSQIASRALSPAVNDPGTAIDIVATQTRILLRWQETDATASPEVVYDRVHLPTLEFQTLLDDAFYAIGRDGATFIELVERMLECLDIIERHLQQNGQSTAAVEKMRLYVVKRAQSAMTFEADKVRLAARSKTA